MTVRSTQEMGDIVEILQKEEYEYSSKERIVILLPLLLGGFISLLNETILNVAFPQLMEDLHVSIGTVQWLGTAYMLIIGVLVPVTAFLIKTFTTRSLYLSAMALFAIGTLLCALSPSFPFLLVSRMLQGAGTGMLLPIMIDTIMEIYPPEKRGTAMGVSMMVVVAAPGIGPTISGFILHYLNWHWLFYFILPFPFVFIFMGMKMLRNVSVITKPKIDAASIVLSTMGFGGLIYGICAIENVGLYDATVLLSLSIGSIGLGVFIWRQLSLRQPMLELRAFRYPMFSLGAVLLFIAFMMPFAVNIIIPTFMQSVLGSTAIVAGLALLPGAVCSVIVSPIAGKLHDRIGAKIPVVTGFVAITITMFFFSRIDESASLFGIIFLQVIMTVGLGLIITPAQTNTLNFLPKEFMVHGVAILNTTQQIAAAFGSSLFIGLMGAVQAKALSQAIQPTVAQTHSAILSGVQASFIAALVIVVLGLVLSVRLKRAVIVAGEHIRK